MADIVLRDTHLFPPAEVCSMAQVVPSRGLSQDESARRLAFFGPNGLPEEPPTPWWRLILDEFDDRMVQILLAAATVSFVMAMLAWDMHDLIEPFVILTILILNAAVGVWQESNAEAAIKALKSLVPSKANVLRDGVLNSIDTENVVPGDIVEIAVGSRVPADIRVIELLSTTVRVDQAMLTGESYEIMKQTEVVDASERFPRNLLFSGTNVTYGKVRGVVIGTGKNTEIGAIDNDVRETADEKTPLQLKLDEFGDLLTKIIGVICIAVFGVTMVRSFFLNKNKPASIAEPILHSIKLAISLAVAAIPEGLPAVVTTCLALGTRKMAQQNALVRNLPSVETLGCCTVICSDKTGTLTTNMMSVSTVVTLNQDTTLRQYRVTDTQFNIAENTVSCNGAVLAQPLKDDMALSHLASVCNVCNDATLEYNQKNKICSTCW
eukprot:PhF_6_TR13659/c0_g1_i1/m.21916/K05853/ATP2A; Ca2+ transporting ATPase, sarcoplasmic/endoplasmic reticulum